MFSCVKQFNLDGGVHAVALGAEMLQCDNGTILSHVFQLKHTIVFKLIFLMNKYYNTSFVSCIEEEKKIPTYFYPLVFPFWDFLLFVSCTM